MQQKSTTTENDGVGLVVTRTCRLNLPAGGLRLEHGGVLTEVEVAYETYGTLSPEADNAVFVCHALTGDAHVAGWHAGDTKPTGWWDKMIGPGRGIDTSRFFVVCANILGGCKGTTGPSSPSPEDGRPYGSRFPAITVGDIVAVHRLLLLQLGIERLYAVIGGSFGGMQALEFAIRFPEMIERCICVAAGPSLTSQALAFDLVGRAAIHQDPNWCQGDYYDSEAPLIGLAQARKLAHITYLSNELMKEKFGRRIRESNTEKVERLASAFRQPFEVESYLDYQGQKFIQRFDANSYLRITEAMDEYDLAERFGSLEEAFGDVLAKVLLIALSGDWLFLPSQSEEMTRAMLARGRKVSYICLDAFAGHDAFLTHTQPLISVVQAFLGARDAKSAMEPPPNGSNDETMLRLLPESYSSVLDLGCGDGRFLSKIATRVPSARRTGVEIDMEQILKALCNGHQVLLADIDRGLDLLPDDSYDCAILSETLQVMRAPDRALEELLRISPTGIVSFPNFGHWLVRLRMLFKGRMPRSRQIPYEWYNTPNIHLCTLIDFLELCDKLGIKVERTICLAYDLPGRILMALGLRNLGASRVLVRIIR